MKNKNVLLILVILIIALVGGVAFFVSKQSLSLSGVTCSDEGKYTCSEGVIYECYQGTWLTWTYCGTSGYSDECKTTDVIDASTEEETWEKLCEKGCADPSANLDQYYCTEGYIVECKTSGWEYYPHICGEDEDETGECTTNEVSDSSDLCEKKKKCVEGKYYCFGNGFLGKCEGGTIVTKVGEIDECSDLDGYINECKIKEPTYGNSYQEICMQDTTPQCVEGKYYCFGTGFVGYCENGVIIRRVDEPNICSDFEGYKNQCKIEEPDYGNSPQEVCEEGTAATTCMYDGIEYETGDTVKECSKIDEKIVDVLTVEVITEDKCDLQTTGQIKCGLGRKCLKGICTSDVCNTNKDCDDKDPCTVDRCITGLLGNKCEFEEVTNCEAKLACEAEGDKWIENVDKDGGLWCKISGIGCEVYDKSYCQSKWVMPIIIGGIIVLVGIISFFIFYRKKQAVF